MRRTLAKVGRRIAALALLIVVAVTSIPAGGLTVDAAKKTEKKAWDGTFESEALGKTPKGWTKTSTESNEKETTTNWAKYYDVKVTDGKKKDTKALVIHGHDTDDGNALKGYVRIDAPRLDVEGGKAYSLNYMMKIQGIEKKSSFHGVRFYAIQLDKDGKQLKKQLLDLEKRDNMDWENFSTYVLMEKDTTALQLSVWVGGSINYSHDMKVFLDEISADKLSENKLLNGGFEKGSGNKDHYSWHMRSTNNINSADYGITTGKWTQWNDAFNINRVEGYHGEGLEIHRPKTGMGYMAMESNMIKVEKNTTFVVDFALKITERDEKTFLGTSVYVNEYDKDKNVISRNKLFTDNFVDLMDWSEFSGYHTVSENAAYISLDLWAGDYYGNTKDHEGHSFTVCYDDVRLAAIERNASKDGVNNGNFEEVYNGTVFDWATWVRDDFKDDIKFSSTFDGYNNSKGMLIEKFGNPPCDKDWFAYITSNRFEVVEGQKYKLTYMARQDNATGNNYFVTHATFYDANGEQVGEAQRAEDHRTQSEEWQQVVGYFEAPKGAKYATVRLRPWGTTFRAYFDDVQWRTHDDKADVWGFDTVDKNGNLAGWTTSSQPDKVKLDKKTYREGTGSLFVSQKADTTPTKITSDVLIPLQKETRYKFTTWIKSYSCNVTTESIRIGAYTYDKEFEKIGTVSGLYRVLNEDSTPSDWKELILAIDTSVNVAYVRPYIQINAGSMNLWIDDFNWEIYDMDLEYMTDFDSVRDDGTPDGWTAEIAKGAPKFESGNSIVKITADSAEDVGVLKARWDSKMEYTQMRLTTSYATSGDAKAKITIKFFDYNDKEVKNARVEKVLDPTNMANVETNFDFLLTSAKYMMIEISNEGAGSIAFDGIHIVQNSEKVQTGDITWRGKWIWYQEDYTDSINSTPRFFRYHFNLPDEAVASNIQITADDRLKMWINGVEVIDPNMDKTYSLISVVNNLQDYLVPGENVIAVRVINYNVHAGLLFDGYAETKSGEWVDFYSDENTVSSLVEYDGWEKPEFDDSNWLNCRIMDLAVGGTTWEDMTYDASAYVKNKIEVVDYSVSDEIEAGEDILLDMTIIPSIDVEKDSELIGHVWKRNTTQKLLSKAMEQVEGPKMSEWKAGKKINVKYRIQVPDFIGSGKYVIQLDLNTVAITNMEIMNNKLTKATVIKNDIGGATTKAEFKEVNGTQALYINGELTPIMSYAAPSYDYDEVNAPKYMHDAGICVTRLWSCPGCGGPSMQAVWTGDNEYNWDALDSYIYEHLSTHEDTYLMLTLNFDAPKWWQTQYPEELVVNNEGDTPGASFFSEKLFRDTIEMNKQMIAHMKEQPYWNRIIGAVLAAGNNAEWFWYGTGQVTMDYSKNAEDAFKAWVKEKYQTDAALQKAWNDPKITLDKVKVPTLEETQGKTFDTLVDPEVQMKVLDYRACMDEKEVELFSRVAKEFTDEVDDNWIFGGYFGYLYSRLLYWDAPLKMHTNIDDILHDENIDFFGAPSNYSERYDGENGGFEQMADGVMAHGKVVMMEDDLRLCSFINMGKNFYTRDSMGPTYNVSDSLSTLIRSFSNQITSGLGNWYYNLEGSFFGREQFGDVMEIMSNEHMVNYAREKDYKTDVAYIIDEDLYSQMAAEFYPNHEVMLEMLYEQRWELSRLGCRMQYYSMTDLEEGLVPDYKVYLMLTSADMDQSERDAVDKHLKNKDKVVLWQYIAGISDGKKVSAKNMSEVIGMDVKVVAETSELGATINNKKHWLTEGLEGTFIGAARSYNKVNPYAIITDSKATVLAEMNDGTGAALAVKENKDWTSVFSAVPCYTTEMLRNILKKCGIHTYSQNLNDVIFANSNYVAVNSAYGGEKVLELDGTYAVYDVFGQETVSLSTNKIKFEMDDNSTKLFRLTPENKHVVYVEVDGNGTSKEAGYHEVKPGSDENYTIKAKDGYIISEIIVDGELKEVEAKKYTVSINDISNSHYIEANFRKVGEDVEEVVVDKESVNYALIAGIIGGSAVVIAALVTTGVLIAKKKRQQNSAV